MIQIKVAEGPQAEMDMNMVFSILPELLILCKDEGEETGAYSSAFCAILMLLRLGLFGLSSITEMVMKRKPLQ